MQFGIHKKENEFYINSADDDILVCTVPGCRLSGIRGRAGSVCRATVHKRHAQQPG